MTDYSQLINEVLNNSTAKNWAQASGEWEIVDCVEDCSCSGQCICGKEQLKYLFTIQNFTNGKILFPIGSSCIKKFEHERLFENAELTKAEFEILHAVADDKYIALKGGLFSRKLLTKLYQEGAFNTAYNNFDGKEDYEFMLKMFNKRNGCSIKQSKKIDAIILNSIKPYLNRKLESKIVDNSLTESAENSTAPVKEL